MKFKGVSEDMLQHMDINLWAYSIVLYTPPRSLYIFFTIASNNRFMNVVE